MPQSSTDDDNPELRRVRRELARLEVLLRRRRVRANVMRALRGCLGGGASFAALVKLKLAGSVVLKGGLALLVGLCFAWPFVAGILLVIVLAALAMLDVMTGDAPSCPGDCWTASKRRDKLRGLIDERIGWLDGRSGEAPRYRRPSREQRISPQTGR